MEELGRFDCCKYKIVGTGFSEGHIFKVGKKMIKMARLV
jgi:hypothetical protein